MTEVTPPVVPPTETPPVVAPAAVTPPVTPPVAPPPANIWPADWRKQLAADDKELPQLERYPSPKEVWGKARELEKKLSSGEYKRSVPFPEKGTAEEQLAWRKESGIPEAPDKYAIKLKNPLTDADKPVVEGFTKLAHSLNMRPDHVNATLQWVLDESARADEDDRKQDETEQKAMQDRLNAEYGHDYRRNMNLVDGLLDTAPHGLKDVLGKTRLADGTLLKNHADMQRFLVSLAMQINPVSTVVPGASGNVGTAITDELAKIEKVMRENRKEYNRDEKMQARYRELLTARDRYAPKAQAA